jgi:hypothetical protein
MLLLLLLLLLLLFFLLTVLLQIAIGDGSARSAGLLSRRPRRGVRCSALAQSPDAARTPRLGAKRAGAHPRQARSRRSSPENCMMEIHSKHDATGDDARLANHTSLNPWTPGATFLLAPCSCQPQ